MPEMTTNEKLQDDNKKYRQLLENLNDVIYTVDRDSRITYISPNVERIAGYCPEEIIGHQYGEFLSAEEKIFLDKNFQKVLSGEDVVAEHKYVTSDNKIIWCINNAGPIYEEGRIKGVQGSLVDITDRKNAENALKQSEQKFREIFNGSNDAIFIHDMYGKFLEVNEVACNRLGYTREELLCMTPLDIDTTENAEFFPKRIHEVDQKGTLVFESVHRCNNGTSIPVEISCRKIDYEGSPCILSVARDITDRLKRETEYAYILNASIDGFLVVDLDGHIIEANPAVANMLGFTQEELCELRISDIDANENPEEVKQHIREIQKTGYDYFETRHKRKDGRLINLEVSSSYLPFGAGLFFSFIRDITSRKLYETEQEKLKAQISTALEMAHLGPWEYDVATDIFTFNDYFYRIYRTTADREGGYTMSSGEYARRFLHPDDIHVVGEQIQKALEIDDPNFRQKIDHRIIYRDGKVGHISVQFFVVKDSQSNTVKTYGVNQDITEHKQALEALRKSEEKYRNIFDYAPIGIFRTDSCGNALMANYTMARILGFSSTQEALDYFYDLGNQLYVQPERRNQFLSLLNKNGYVENFEYEARTYGGNSVWLSMNAVAIPSQEDESFIIEGFTTDITDRKKAEEKAARMQEQFQQAQKMESIGRLAGGVAHDLNNLLSPILGYGEILLEEASEKDPRRETIEEIVNAGKRAKSLVRQLLAFSRRQPLQFEPIDLNELLKNFKKLLRRTLREDIKIKISLARSIPKVKGDAGQLEQMILNLAINSQDAMSGGGIFTIETDQVELGESYAEQKRGVIPGNYIKLAASDSGTGMNAHTLKHLFEPFFTTKEIGKGTGLGMSTVYGIVKQHGGNIWAYSEPGLGTTIKIYFPVLTGSSKKGSRTKQAPSVAHGSETVLLVEDDKQVRNLVTTVLERYGYTILAAEDGIKALSILGSHEGKIDLLLTDLIMPNINGKELFEKVATTHPYIKVLYMSGYTDDVIAHHGVIEDGVNFVEKPFNIKDLMKKVRKVLEQ